VSASDKRATFAALAAQLERMDKALEGTWGEIRSYGPRPNEEITLMLYLRRNLPTILEALKSDASATHASKDEKAILERALEVILERQIALGHAAEWTAESEANRAADMLRKLIASTDRERSNG